MGLCTRSPSPTLRCHHRSRNLKPRRGSLGLPSPGRAVCVFAEIVVAEGKIEQGIAGRQQEQGKLKTRESSDSPRKSETSCNVSASPLFRSFV